MIYNNIQEKELLENSTDTHEHNEIDIFNETLYIEFPYKLVLDKKISFHECNLFFTIFEHVMLKHLLNNSKKQLPKIYFDFKEVILNSLMK